uniref:glucan endo-1,3-beta-D-glucosidase n=1 Tax=Thraustotheca clavata TaxID=74557 RepID=A0A0A7CMS1_9STRA|nr:secreted protein [Thraustotheca clavata]
MLRALVASITLAFAATSASPILQSACYSPFHLDAYPLISSQVLNYSTLYPAIYNDFQLMQPYVNTVRTYYSNYYGIDVAPIAASANVPLYLGVFMTRASWYSSQVQSAITAGVNYTSTVKAILLGNENVAKSPNDQYTPSEVADQIYYVRDQISKRSNGKASVPIGTVQKIGDWLDSDLNKRAEMQKLADACDIIGVNIYPFFSDGYDASNPMAILDKLWNQMLEIYPASKVRLTETGFSTGGNVVNANPPVVPNLDNSVNYYNALMKWTPKEGGGDVFWYTFFDLRSDDTTQQEEYEKYFGFYTANGKPKSANYPVKLSVLRHQHPRQHPH